MEKFFEQSAWFHSVFKLLHITSPIFFEVTFQMKTLIKFRFKKSLASVVARREASVVPTWPKNKLIVKPSKEAVSFYNAILSFLAKRRVTDIAKLVSFKIACESSSPRMNLMNFIDKSNSVLCSRDSELNPWRYEKVMRHFIDEDH